MPRKSYFPPNDVVFDYRPNHPILIIPGFMSSGLFIKATAHYPQWQNERIWISLGKLGINALNFGKLERTVTARDRDGRAVQVVREKASGISKLLFGQSKEVRGTMNRDLYLDDRDFQSEEHAKRNRWIQHICVDTEDGFSDPPGIQVRPVEGLAGVDFLEPGAITKALSYVFGHVIAALEAVGYVPGDNLCAAPYDWRLMPRKLQERDQYFSKVMFAVEKMYQDNGSRPVVLLGHSMGTRCIQFFLNWVKFESGQGQVWIDKYVHSFFAAGPLWLGAPKACRAIVNGDKMGLDTFLQDEHALVLGRSLGSGCWCLPIQDWAAPNLTFAYASSFTRIEGFYRVELFAADLRRLVGKEDRTFAIVEVKKKVLVDDPFRQTRLNTMEVVGRTPAYNAAFEFVSERPDQVSLNEVISIKIKKASGMVAGVVGTTQGMRWSQKTVAANEVTIASLLRGQPTYSGPFPLSQKAAIHIRIEFVPYSSLSQEVASKIAAYNPNFQGFNPPTGWYPVHRTNPNKRYQPRKNQEMMALDNIDYKLRQWYQYYEGDPNFGFTEGSTLPRVLHPPPCKLKVVYGINLDTEVMTFYRRKTFRLVRGATNSKYKPDKSAVIQGNNTLTVKGGIAYETRNTQQVIPDTGETRTVSGDGTVPYLSMRYCKLWEKQYGFPVDITELEAAEHREMLADKRLHAVIVEYACTRPKLLVEVRIHGAVNLASPRKNGDIDVYVEASIRGRAFKTERVKSLVPEFTGGIFKVGYKEEVVPDEEVLFQIYDKDVFNTVLVAEARVMMTALIAHKKSQVPLHPSGSLVISASPLPQPTEEFSSNIRVLPATETMRMHHHPHLPSEALQGDAGDYLSASSGQSSEQDCHNVTRTSALDDLEVSSLSSDQSSSRRSTATSEALGNTLGELRLSTDERRYEVPEASAPPPPSAAPAAAAAPANGLSQTAAADEDDFSLF